MLNTALSTLTKRTNSFIKGRLVNLSSQGNNVVFELKLADGTIYKLVTTVTQAESILQKLSLPINAAKAAVSSGISESLREEIVRKNIVIEAPVEPGSTPTSGKLSSGGEKITAKIEDPAVTKQKADAEKKELEDAATVFPVSEWPAVAENPRFLPVRVPNIVGTSKTRIGYAVFSSPVQFFTSQRTSYIEQTPTLRESGTIKKGTGLSYQTYTLNYIANDAYEIRTSVKDVFDQLLLNPFISCEGGPFGFDKGEGDIPYHDFAVRSFSLATVPGNPSSINVQLSLEPLLFDHYCQIKECKESATGFQVNMDDIVCWPLVKLWAGSNNKSTYQPEQSALNGTVRMTFPSKRIVDKIVNEVENLRSKLIDTEADTLSTLKVLLTEPLNAAITSNNAKLIESSDLVGSGRRVAVVKLSEKNNYEELIKQSAFIGLVRWEKFSGNRFSAQGTFLPQSGRVNLNRSSAIVNNTVGVTKYTTVGANEFSWVDIYNNGNLKQLMRDFLHDEQRQRAPLNSGADSLPSMNPLTDNMILQILDNPWEYFAIVLDVREETKDNVLNKITKLLAAAQLKAELPSQSERKLFERILSQDSEVGQEILFDAAPGKSDTIVESIMATRLNNLATQNVHGIPIPMHQYLGGGSAEFSMKGKCTSKKAKRALETLKLEFDRRCHLAFSGPNAGSIKENPQSTPFIRITNEIFQLMGVDFVMPVSLNIDSIPDQPNVWEFEMVLLEYNPSTQSAERIKFLETTLQAQSALLNYQSPGNNTPDPLIQKAQEFFSLDDSLKRLEVLKDMRLPTKKIVEKWIDILKEEALYRVQNNKPRSKATLSVEEIEVIDLCEQFFQDKESLNIISKFRERDATNRTSYAGAFVDPDFYFFYDPEKTWGAILDKLGLQEFGKRTAGYGSEVPEENGLEAYYREFSPLFGTTSIYSKDYLSSRASETENEMLSAIKNSFPRDKAKAADEATKSQVAGEKFEQYPGAWWTTPTNISPVDENKTFTDSNDEYYKGPFMSPNTKVSAFDSNSVENKVTPAEFDATVEEFLSLAWRRKRAEVNTSYAIKDSNINTSINPMLINTGFLYSVKPAYTYQAIGGSIGDFGKINDYADALPMDGGYVAGRLSGLLNPNGKNTLLDVENDAKLGLTRSSDNLDIDWGYIPRSILATRKYSRFYKKSLDISSVSFSAIQATTPTEALVKLWEPFDRIAGKYAIDPNIVRAFFLRRTGFGTAKNQTQNPDDVGFGDLSVDIALNLRPEEQVDLFCEKFRRNLDRLNGSPTLAMAATIAQLTSKGRAAYVTLLGKSTKEPGGETDKFKLNTDIFFNVLKNAASRLGSVEQRYSAAGAQIIRDALNKTSLAADVDTYWTAYIEVCRTLGSVRTSTEYLNKIDVFFDPFHALILTDSENNEEYASTTLTPSGENNRVSMTRGSVSQVSGDINVLGDPNQPISAEQDAEMRRRLKFGLEPHSEASAWGSMLDCRKYTVFGRFVQAFPTFSVLIINEGFYFAEGSVKLWDQFYTRGGITSIEVFKSRKEPAHQCSVTFSNMFYSISRYTQMEALRQELAVDANNRFQKTFGLGTGSPIVSIENALKRFWTTAVTKEPDPRLIKTWATNHLNQLALTAGARIQVRMGYGSNAAALPIVFNGTVIDAPIGGQGEVTIMAAGDGFELDNPITDRLVKVDSGFAHRSQEGFLGAGTEPSQIVVQSMIPNTMLVASISQGRYGVTRVAPHFGEIVFGTFGYSIPEVMMNMYGATRKHLEQSFNFWKNTFNKNALYNWDETSLISVSVHEPTVWRTAKICSQAVLDFTTSVEPFHTRSSLFFGKWWYPFNYEYAPAILNQNNISAFYKSTRALTTDGGSSTDGTAVKNLEPKAIVYQPRQDIQQALNSLPEGQLKEYLLKKTRVDTLVTFKEFGKHPDAFITAAGGIGSLFGILPGLVATSLASDYRNKSGTLDEGESWAYVIFNTPSGSSYAEKLTWDINGNLRAERYSTFTWEAPKYVGTKTLTLPEREFSGTLESDALLADGKLGADPTMLRDVENFVKYLHWKPYMQVWPAMTGLNLISNTITPSQKHVYTDAKGQHTFNGWITKDAAVKTITYCVDSDISPSTRRTLMVDTGLLVTTVQRGFANTVAKGAANVTNSLLGFTPWTPVIADFINETPDTPAVENSVVSGLCDSVKEMYQGWFSMLGQSGIKPNDLILLNDSYNGLEGPVFARDVIHRMDTQTGFITLISPDCVALPHSAVIGQRLIISHSCGPLAKAGQYIIGATLWSAMSYSTKRMAMRPYQQRIKQLESAAKEYASNDILGGNFSLERVKSLALKSIDRRIAELEETGLGKVLSVFRVNELKKTRKAVEESQSLTAIFIRTREAGLNIAKDVFGGTSVGTGIEALLTAIAEVQAEYTYYMTQLDVDPLTADLTREQKIALAERKALGTLNTKLADPKLKEVISQAAASEGELILEEKRLIAKLSSLDAASDEYKSIQKVLLEVRNKLGAILDLTSNDDLKQLHIFLKDINNFNGVIPIDGSDLGLADDVAEAVEDAWAVAKFKNASPSMKLISLLKGVENNLADDAKLAKAARALSKQLSTVGLVASSVGPGIVLRLAFEVIRFSIGQTVVQSINSRLLARQAVKIIPLRSIQSNGSSIPYVAGIRGHQGAVVGDDPGFFDKIFSGKFEPSLPLLDGMRLSTLVTAFFGVEIPEYGNTDADNLYLEKMKEIERSRTKRSK